ncbi:hypothetical protein ABID14_000327 [Peptoniphilus olsenii]|uniref:Restriction endonuclease type IV Mrr domain-containing protein n=1 Tax=Peptoniphilus olsenii TaxID=411570 RepID=A0ABV2J7E9_9FIRM
MELPNLSQFGFEFEKCQNKKEYSIYHKEIPLELSEEMTKILEYLLWYVPNINSIQSKKNELTSSLNFENFVFGIIKNYMNLRNKDVVFLDYIDPKIVRFYSHKICTHSQKLILTKQSNESLTDSLLRHIRNCLAHGNFNIVDNLLVGFDYNDSKNDEKKCTAIFKIFPKNLLDALFSLKNEITSEMLAQVALQRTGYKVERFKRNDIGPDFDLFVTKGDKKYALEIKKYEEYEILPNYEAEKLVKSFSCLYNNITPVLFIDTSLLREETKTKLKNEKVIILDVKNINKMLKNRDILKEIDDLE